MKTFAITFGEVVGIPSALLILLLMFGIDFGDENIKTVANISRDYGPFLLVLLAIGVGGWTTSKLVREDRQKYETDFYNENEQARLEKAHFVFFSLRKEGEQLWYAKPEDRNKWDEELQKQIKLYCNETALNIYLLNTGRHAIGAGSNPLPEDKLDYALKFISVNLDRDFEHFFKN